MPHVMTLSFDGETNRLLVELKKKKINISEVFRKAVYDKYVSIVMGDSNERKEQNNIADGGS